MCHSVRELKNNTKDKCFTNFLAQFKCDCTQRTIVACVTHNSTRSFGSISFSEGLIYQSPCALSSMHMLILSEAPYKQTYISHFNHNRPLRHNHLSIKSTHSPSPRTNFSHHQPFLVQ